MIDALDGDKIDSYLSGGVETEDYLDTKRDLTTIRDAFPSVKYMYVYKIEEDGCHVVFDLDAPDMPGGQLGELIDFDPTFEPYLQSLLKGEEIEPIVSNDQYGWLLTVYRPIHNSAGQCVAYAAADIDMQDLLSDNLIFIIRLISLLFAVAILVVIFSLWYSDKRIIRPINALVKQSRDFELNQTQGRNVIPSVTVDTGDELEVLYTAIHKGQTSIVQYISEVNSKKDTIYKMQRNIIISFANMVENRDSNTGKHIRRTSLYVSILTKQMQKGKYADVITDDYLTQVIQSAPLHDIGKISISDTILNKPGKLTPTEFEIIKTHTTAGKEILQSALDGIEEGEYLGVAMDMALSHHEK